MLLQRYIVESCRKRKASTNGTMVDMNLLQKDEIAVIKLYQWLAFQKEIVTENGRAISSQSSVFKLDPFLDNDGVLSVGELIRPT